MTTWKVLSVDDDKEMQDALERAIAGGFDDDEFLFTKTTNFEEGINYIRDGRFDLVFLDVNDEASDPDPSIEGGNKPQRGEELLEVIKSERFLPVVFYTGYAAKVTHLASPVVKVVEKGAELNEIRTAVGEILDTKLPHLYRKIEDLSRNYIWESLDSLFSSKVEGLEAYEIALLAARNLSLNLSQFSVRDLLGLEESKIKPLEMYLYPPRPETCSPADIFKKRNDGSMWMVLTPACDFEQNNVENVLLAKVVPVSEHPLYIDWVKEAASFNRLSKEEQRAKAAKSGVNSARNEVKNLVKGRYKQRYKFLPGTFFIPDSVVDFQEVRIEPRINEAEFEVVCSLDNPYREELLQYFSRYYGRIGTPDLDLDGLWGVIDERFSSQKGTEYTS